MIPKLLKPSREKTLADLFMIFQTNHPAHEAWASLLARKGVFCGVTK